MSSVLHDASIFLRGVGWRDVADILIVAILLYQVFKLIRGTQAVQLLVGLGVLLVVGLLAEVFQLRLLQFIFANAGQAILIGVIVLFQPELRRALDRVGRLGTVGWTASRHPSVPITHVIDEVIRAAGSLSESRRGALIVFQRETGLENVALSGVRINGEVTAEMLTTLFFEGSPLHDGAVIIHEGRLEAAGCVLPLADALPGAGRMGTRHRAALGLTFQSDAVVLIISEETGFISLAYGGKLYRGLDTAKLTEMLTNLLHRPGVPRPGVAIRPLVRSGAALRSLGRRSP
ncbi:MAG: diadenylate cyclase CdaA [Candidatus Dormibacteria bacterium]|jgi:diadenylate cyclase